MIHKQTHKLVVGHAQQRAALKSLISRDKLPSAMIFAGPSGVGKSLVAMELIQTLFCKAQANYGGCGTCHGCKQLSANSHPDFHRFECSNKEETAVEEWRELLRSLALKSFEGGAKVILINDAELISLQAANTLLKTLEEPSSRTYFILLCSNPGRLPATIRSRCQRWFFNPLSEEEISQIIKDSPELSAQFNARSLGRISTLSNGTLSNLLQIAEREEDWEKLSTALRQIGNGDLKKALDLGKEISQDKEILKVRLSLLRIAARTLLHESVSQGKTQLQQRSSDLLSNLILAEGLIFERNLNAGYVLSNIFTAFSAQGENGVWRYRNPSRLEQMIVGFN